MGQTLEEFIKMWEDWMIGMATKGIISASDIKPEGPYSAGKLAIEAPDKVRRVLTRMYLNLDKPPKPTGVSSSSKESVNGKETRPGNAPSPQGTETPNAGNAPGGKPA